MTMLNSVAVAAYITALFQHISRPGETAGKRSYATRFEPGTT
jgi:hypothetical protein